MKLDAMKKTYGGRTVLDLPELELEAGKIYSVIGANGSGKSTFAGILAGTEAPDGGKAAAASDSQGYMPQKSYAFRMSVKRNLLLSGGSPEKAEELMEKFALAELAGKNAKKLSGGETAKLALARLLMKDYKLLILDEPTAAMDMESTLAAERLICGYCRRTGCTVLWITHSLQQAKRCSDVTLFLNNGRLGEMGETLKLLTAPVNEDTGKFIEFYGIDR